MNGNITLQNSELAGIIISELGDVKKAEDAVVTENADGTVGLNFTLSQDEITSIVSTFVTGMFATAGITIGTLTFSSQDANGFTFAF